MEAEVVGWRRWDGAATGHGRGREWRGEGEGLGGDGGRGRLLGRGGFGGGGDKEGLGSGGLEEGPLPRTHLMVHPRVVRQRAACRRRRECG